MWGNFSNYAEEKPILIIDEIWKFWKDLKEKWLKFGSLKEVLLKTFGNYVEGVLDEYKSLKNEFKQGKAND